MSNYQQLTIIGRVGRDAEMRYTNSGQAVTSFSVAVSEQYTKDNEKIKTTVWFRVSSWGKQAEVCNQYVKKGMLVQVVGKLKGDEGGNPRIYTKQDGSAASSFEMTALNVLFLSKVEGDQTAQVEEEAPF
jgi:single-strand DNA-binding protein